MRSSGASWDVAAAAAHALLLGSSPDRRPGASLDARFMACLRVVEACRSARGRDDFHPAMRIDLYLEITDAAIGTYPPAQRLGAVALLDFFDPVDLPG